MGRRRGVRSSGVLGHGDGGRYVQPELVRALYDRDMKVMDVACGQTHTVVATGGVPALRK